MSDLVIPYFGIKSETIKNLVILVHPKLILHYHPLHNKYLFRTKEIQRYNKERKTILDGMRQKFKMKYLHIKMIYWRKNVFGGKWIALTQEK